MGTPTPYQTASADEGAPRTSLVGVAPVTPTSRRPRAEECERLSAADLRPLITPTSRSHCLPDGSELQLRWSPVRGCWGGRGGVSLLLACPLCGAMARALWRPPGQGWGCRRCHLVSHRSHRRSGSQRGRRKPASWHLDRIEAEQHRVVELLGLEQWPPAEVFWNLEDLQRIPRRWDAPRISAKRFEALLLRLDLLESIRWGAALPILHRYGGEDPDRSPLQTLANRARLVLRTTDWAVRRPAQDGRTTRGSRYPPLAA